MNGSEVARFWAKVDRNGPVPPSRPELGACWLWTASRNVRRGGYGQVKIAGRVRRAHIVAYELVIGSVPEGKQLDHLCDVTHCVNPAHLRPKTAHANNLRSGSRAAVQARAAVCPAGHPYDDEHLYVRPDGRRECRTCASERQRERRAS